MIKIDYSNLEKINPTHGLSLSEIKEKNDQLPEYLRNILQKDLGFHKIPDNKEIVEQIVEFASNLQSNFKDLQHIIVLGIGGSALGTTSIQQSLKNLFQNEIGNNRFPSLHVIDNIDPVLIKELTGIIDPKKTLFIVVTKSGGTPETIAQYLYFRGVCDQLNLPAEKHFAFITDPEKGLLRKIANEEKIPSFEVPQNVGGRFSVLTPVGLLPSALIGIDIKKLLNGAQSMRGNFISESPSENSAYLIAVIQFLLSQKGKNINVIMPYAQKLIRFSEWYNQLLAESIGKKLNNEGKEVFAGITPVNALGATDQHSQTQLYNEGPNDKLIILIKIKNHCEEIKIPEPPNEESLSYLKNTSFNELLHMEMEGTIGSLVKNDRPVITLEIEKLDEESLGELFMLFEGSTAFLGELFNINAFDQPGVELSKQLTKQLLLSKQHGNSKI